MRVLELPAGRTPRQWGQVHGESFRGEIAALTAIRVYLCTRAGKMGRFADAAGVLEAAAAHLPVLERFHRGLYDELCGIAEGAALTPAHIVVANHYTDLRDLDPDHARWQPAPTTSTASMAGAATRDADAPEGDGCSVLFAASPSGRVLGQTWDMHATASPYVMALHVPESAQGPEAWILTVTGCLGMSGLNGARLAISINNLNSTDATVGVVWPALVRRALQQSSATAARDLILASPVGSGRHYFVADRKDAFAIETSGKLRKVMFRGDAAAYCHTNHCLDPEVDAVSMVPPASTTRDRYAWLTSSLAASPVAGLDDVWTRLGSTDGWPRSVCTQMATPENPHGAATCGAIAMNLDSGEVWAQAGLIHRVAADRFAMAPRGEHPS